MNERKKQRLFRFAVDLFIDLLQQVTKRKNIPYRCNDVDVQSWDKFVQTFGDGIGEEFVREFIEYGIQSWFNESNKKDYSHSVRFNWMVGAAAIRRWNALSPTARTWCVRIGIKKDTKIKVKHESKRDELLLRVRSAEERIKTEYHNTNRGLLWCVANTTLYFHKSTACATCTNKENCKQILKEQYPRVYKLRGYGEKQ